MTDRSMRRPKELLDSVPQAATRSAIVQFAFAVRVGLLSPLAIALVVTQGCGRIGVEILPFLDGGDGGDIADDGGEDDDGSAQGGDDDGGIDDDSGAVDAGAELDARADASDGASADACDGAGCVVSCDVGSYVPNASCGQGYCRTTNTPSRCVNGLEVACVPGAPRAMNDSTCDGVDDDCSGGVDEDYTSVAQCGVGYCRTTSTPARCTGGVVTACTPGAPRASSDTTLDGVDDDCDGQTDEDVCVPRTDTYRAGSFMFSPPPGCTTVSVKLWGGGGTSGDAQAGFWGLAVVGGQGGAGGYAESSFTLSTSAMLQLYVGAGARACPNAGAGAIAAHNGGAGGSSMPAQNGSAGADGSRTGGSGGNASSGGDGGAGSFGGGGGGSGSTPGFAAYGRGGGGGAATVLIVNSMSVIAGGGGGGGGAGADITTAGHSGGNGGAGCSAVGTTASSEGGGGGGGGVCQGTLTQAGSGRTPYDPGAVLPSGAVRGGNSTTDCDPGGDGYATVSYTR
jgi:hypothetical protein